FAPRAGRRAHQSDPAARHPERKDARSGGRPGAGCAVTRRCREGMTGIFEGCRPACERGGSACQAVCILRKGRYAPKPHFASFFWPSGEIGLFLMTAANTPQAEQGRPAAELEDFGAETVSPAPNYTQP